MSILIIAGSARQDSVNRKLQHRIAEVAEQLGIAYRLYEPSELDAPLYHGDLEQEEGVPASMQRFAEAVAGASKVVVISPEYNASVPPLLKNAIDWSSRVDGSVWAGKTVLLGAASPGALGGMRGLSHLRDILTNVLAWIAPLMASCKNANDETIAAMDDDYLQKFLKQGD